MKSRSCFFAIANARSFSVSCMPFFFNLPLPSIVLIHSITFCSSIWPSSIWPSCVKNCCIGLGLGFGIGLGLGLGLGLFNMSRLGLDSLRFFTLDFWLLTLYSWLLTIDYWLLTLKSCLLDDWLVDVGFEWSKQRTKKDPNKRSKQKFNHF